MVELDQFRYRISGYDKQLDDIKKSLDLDSKKKRIEELEADMEAPGFWDDPDKSQKATVSYTHLTLPTIETV